MSGQVVRIQPLKLKSGTKWIGTFPGNGGNVKTLLYCVPELFFSGGFYSAQMGEA